jgi:hypothetical protein
VAAMFCVLVTTVTYLDCSVQSAVGGYVGSLWVVLPLLGPIVRGGGQLLMMICNVLWLDDVRCVAFRLTWQMLSYVALMTTVPQLMPVECQLLLWALSKRAMQLCAGRECLIGALCCCLHGGQIWWSQDNFTAVWHVAEPCRGWGA